MSAVQTVRGPVAPGDLGRTLMHEHVVNITPEIARDFPARSWGGDPSENLDAVVTRLQEVRDRGVSTIVDATAFGHGRDLGLVRAINERVDLNIVVATGIYTYDALPFYFDFHPARRTPDGALEDVMVEMFVEDVTVGIQGTGVKAGVIKCATDKPGVTPNVERVLRAVAQAHLITGVPITTHTVVAERNGLDQQRIFVEEGVDLRNVIIGHSGDATDIAYLRELLDRGSTIGADRFGMYLPGFPSFEERVATVAELCRLGYADRIVLSHDYTPYTDWLDDAFAATLPERWRQTHVSDEVLPALRAAGVADEQIDAMLIHNPRRLLMPVAAR